MIGAAVPAGAYGEPWNAPGRPPPPAARIPGLARRLVVGTSRFVGLAIALGWVPYEILVRLAAFHVVSGVPPDDLLVAGVGLAFLAAARYVAKPSRAYGPVAMLAGAAGVAYLLWLGAHATLVIAPFSRVGLTISYGAVLDLLAIAPALRLVAGAVTTVEDLRRPGERLPFDFPA